MEKIRVIIVDDINYMLDGIKTQLSQEESVEVVATAINRTQCLSELQAKEVDIVLMDYDFRGAEYDGATLTKEILEIYPNVKVLIISAYDDIAFIHKAIKNGAVGYIDKYKKEVLMLAIQSIMNDEIYVDAIILKQIWFYLKSSFFSPNTSTSTFVKLTSSEKEVVEAIVKHKQYSYQEIANYLGMSANGSAGHIRNIAAKWNLSGGNLVLKIYEVAIQYPSLWQIIQRSVKKM